MGKEEKEDPWFDMERDLETRTRAMLDVREKFTAASLERKAIEHEGKTPPAELVNRVRKCLDLLEKSLEDLNPDFEIMSQGLQNATEHPERCKVTPAELIRRQEVFASIKRKIQMGQQDLTSGQRYEEKRRANASNPEMQDVGPSAISLHMEQAMDEQRTHAVKTDAALDRIHHGLGELENKAGMIGGAIDDSNKTLGALEKDMAAVGIKMDNAIHKVNELLARTSDKGKIGIIVFLLIVLVLLCVVLFSGDSSGTTST